jgi:hypothetical protein
MTTLHSIESKIVWGALTMFAVATTACGGAAQSMTGTAPSSLPAISGAPDTGGLFGLLKNGNGRGPDGRTGDIPTTPTVPGNDQGGDGSGHGHAALQFEGFTSDITGTCPDLTIVINEQTVITNEDTDFQRADCADLQPVTTTAPTTNTTASVGTRAETTPTTTALEEPGVFHLHIAAIMDADGNLVATYVRMQGPKSGGSDEDENATTPQ